MMNLALLLFGVTLAALLAAPATWWLCGAPYALFLVKMAFCCGFAAFVLVEILFNGPTPRR